MKINKEIISLIFFCFFGISFLVFVKVQNNKNQKNIGIQHHEKIKKKNNHDDHHQLVSYFWVFLVFFIFFKIILHIIIDCFFNLFNRCFDNYHFEHIDQNSYLYLTFIKEVLDMFIYKKISIQEEEEENKEKTYAKRTKEYENLLNFNEEQFLQEFFWNSQINEVRCQSQKILLSYRRIFYFYLIIFYFLINIVCYLLSFIVNLIVNFLFHQKNTWKNLKWNSLWMLIPNMQHQYERIFSTLLLLAPFLRDFYDIFFHCCLKHCIFSHNITGFYSLLDVFLKEHKPCNQDSFRYSSMNFDNIPFLVLDKKYSKKIDNVWYCTGYMDKKFLDEKFDIFLKNIKKDYLNENSFFEKKVFQEIEKFINFISNRKKTEKIIL